MADATALKAERDFSKEAEKQIPAAEELAKTDVQAAIDKLYLLEKQTRQASDLHSSTRVLVAIVTMCKRSGDWNLLNDQVLLLSKKHGQLKQAITRMVQVVMEFLDETPGMETKLSVIETLRTVTEGKIFVEVERARVTRILCEIKKAQGDTTAARDILCELQVETFGSMPRREKTDFILEQVALCIECGDWVQAGILSRKISTRYFARKPKKTPEQLEKERKAREEKERTRSADEPPPEPDDDVTDLKLRYYEQQIILAKHDDQYLEVCKHYRQVLDTEAVENNPDQLRASLQRIIYFAVLAPYDNEQSDLLQRIARDSRNAQIPTDAALLKLFTIPELMRWPMVAQQFGPHLCSTDVFSAEPVSSSNGASTTSPPPPASTTPNTNTSTITPHSGPGPSSSSPSTDAKASTRWTDLRKRVIEHNVRVVARYYTRIAMARLTTLLDLHETETEAYISDLVTAKTIYAKIDRPAGVVSFAKPRDADDVLNEWSASMKALLGLLERIDHLITKEEMMARIQMPGPAEQRPARGAKVH